MRTIITLTCENKFMAGAFGTTPNYYCRDAEGNMVYYRGLSPFIAPGETGTFKVTLNGFTDSSETTAWIKRPVKV